MGADWEYLDDGSDQGTAWRSTDFDDAGWKSGPATLGYGDSGDATTVSFGRDYKDKYITTYFRLAFTVADASAYSGLDLDLIRDDGAVVYLNGTEVFRSNMPTGDITYTTTASTSLGGASESAVHGDSFSASALVDGLNVLAVEVHQANASSSDLRFNLSLMAEAANAAEASAAIADGSPTLATTAVGLAPQSAAPSASAVSVSRAASVRPTIGAKTSIPQFVWRGRILTGSVRGDGWWRSDLPIGFDV
jgi:hypothetical protein